MAHSKIISVIPTYNEFQVLKECLEGLYNQNIEGLEIFIVNAGTDIPFELSPICTVWPVDSSFFWSHSVEYGFQKVRELATSPDFVFLTNADIKIIPNTLNQLLNVSIADQKNKLICSAPTYTKINDRLKLLYSHVELKYLLTYEPPARSWSFFEDAPSENFKVKLTGGQAVLIPFNFIKENKIDKEHFPQYMGDIDYWLTANKLGYEIIIVPTTAGVELRASGGEKMKTKISFTIKNLLDLYNPFSLTIRWNLVKKHLPFPTAIVSLIMYFLYRVLGRIKNKVLIITKK